MFSSRCSASSLVFANRTIPLCNVGETISDAYQSITGECDYGRERRKKERYIEGQSPVKLDMHVPKCGNTQDIFRNFVRTFSTSSSYFIVHVDAKKNYYLTLGVTPHCSAVKIKQAYYRLSKVYHPDINKTEAAVKKFHEITEAYEVLSSPSLRHQYDSHRRGHGHGLHRGNFRPGPTNFKARGPHQQVRTDHYNYDEWLKGHYSETFKRRQEQFETIKRWQGYENEQHKHFISFMSIMISIIRPKATMMFLFMLSKRILFSLVVLSLGIALANIYNR